MEQMMKQSKLQWMRSLVGVCGVLSMLAAWQTGSAQQAAPARVVSSALSSMPGAVATVARPAPRPQAEEEETAKPGKPGGEGIKIHGHWVMQVKNADGTLGDRREFDNSLVTIGLVVSGDQLLAGLLSGNLVTGGTTIGFIQGTPSFDPSYLCGNGLINQPPNGSINWSCYEPATPPTAVVTFSPAVNWVISTNFTVPSGYSTINSVETLVYTCFNTSASFDSGNAAFSFVGSIGGQTSTIPASSCNTNIGPPNVSVPIPLTYTTIKSGTPAVSSPLPVTPGQIVTTTVTITFS
jgi:hypothetical protein